MKLYERKWQLLWEKRKVFEADPGKGEKFFITFPYPYVNCSPHIGHSYSALRADMMARYHRMKGDNTLYPQAWHLTGEPLMGAAKRIEKGEKKQFEIFKKAGVPEDEIESFKNPEKMAEYFIEKWEEEWGRLGMSVDWRRSFHTTSMDECYDQFVKWQFKRLKEMGLVGKGTHPVIYCPKCESPTGSHDRLEGEGASIVKYLMILFKMGDTVLPAATLRPETTYGVTNMWVNPEVVYAKAKVNGEEWVLSYPALHKLQDQGYDAEEVGKVEGSELLGKKVKNPVTGDEIIVLPTDFVDPDSATGVVMSVPSHAPYDHIALQDLKESKKWGSEVKKIKYVHLIDSKGFGKHPAIQVCEGLGVESQEQVQRLEEATSTVYKKEFHKGVMNEKCGPFAGNLVSESKDALIKHFTKKGWGSIMYESSEQVVCRCTELTHVKLLKDQWFIKYSDEAWKNKALKALDKMKIYPEEARPWFENAIKGMNDKACARKSGLGTKLPWDDEWIIEPLSDSTIYMAYYIIAKYVNEGELHAGNLKPEFFDYVLLGKNVHNVSKKTSVKKKLLDKIREEFEYFYPVDMRSSGKDLVPHHLCFFIYNHVAFWPEKYWPKSVSVNGWVKYEGKKMSKSKGNFLPLSKVLDEFGADAARLALFDTAEGLDDPDFRKSNANNFLKKMDRLLEEAELLKKRGSRPYNNMDKWLLARVQDRVQATGAFLDKTLNRHALQEGFHGMYADLMTYLSREEPNKKVLEHFFSVFTRLCVPFAPHFAEELHNKVGGKGLVHEKEWPKIEKKFVNKDIQVLVSYLDSLKKDVRNVQELIKKDDLAQITVIVASDWKNVVAKEARQAVDEGLFKQLITRVMKSKAKKYGKMAAKLAKTYSKDPNKIPENVIGGEKEEKLLRDNKNVLEEEFDCTVRVEREEESDSPKAHKAMPMKPSIILD